MSGQPNFHMKKQLKTNKCQIFRENELNQSRKRIVHNTFPPPPPRLSGHLLLLGYLCYYYTCEREKKHKT